MTTLTTILAACTVSLPLAGAPLAAPCANDGVSVRLADTQNTSGVIRSVDIDGGSFVINAGERRVSMTFDDNTAFTLDGEESSREEVLKAGRNVTVKHEEGSNLAIAVAATSSVG